MKCHYHHHCPDLLQDTTHSGHAGELFRAYVAAGSHAWLKHEVFLLLSTHASITTCTSSASPDTYNERVLHKQIKTCQPSNSFSSHQCTLWYKLTRIQYLQNETLDNRKFSGIIFCAIFIKTYFTDKRDVKPLIYYNDALNHFLLKSILTNLFRIANSSIYTMW